jgi:hypothetical protein
VVHGPAGWLAAGWDRSGGDADAAVWASDDGSTWVQQRADPLGGAGRQAIAALAVAGERTVAAGWTSGPDGDLDGAVWIGSGGGWTPAPGEALGGLGDQGLWAVAADATTIVVAGSETTTGDPRPAVWTGGDGIAWERATGSGLDGSGSIRAVVRIDGAWVAAGSSGPSGEAVPAIWRSGDGAAWPDGPEAIQAPDEPGDTPAGAVMAIVDPGARRLVAAGLVLTASPVAWLADVS